MSDSHTHVPGQPPVPEEEKLGFTGLTAMIIGSTIGGGIFTTAGDMASSGAHTIV